MKRALHLAGQVGLGAALTGAIVALSAAPALAASTISVTPGGTLDHNAVLNASATYDNSGGAQTQSIELDVARPDSSTVALAKSSVGPLSTKTLTGSVDTSTLNINGDYLFTLKGSSGVVKSATVTLRVPPAVVSNFSGTPSGTVAHFTWSANGEPDLAGYDIVDVTDAQQPRDLTPSGLSPSVCSGGSCAVDIDFGSSAQGTSRTFVAYALRYTSPSHSSTVASASPSSAATVAFPAPAPPPSSAPPSSSGGSAAGSGGGSTGSGGGTASAGQTSGSMSSGGAAGRGAHHTAPISTTHASKALKAYLPTISAGAAPNLPSVVTEVQPLPQGTYKPTLAYPDQVIPQVVHKRTSTPIASVRNEIVRVLDVGALWKALSAAAVLLLVAGHLRAWLDSVDLAER